MPEAQAPKRKPAAGQKRASKADIKKIAREMFGDEVEVFRDQTQDLARALEARLAAAAKDAEAREAQARKEHDRYLVRQAALQGQIPDLQAIVEPLRAEVKALSAAVVRFRGELQALGVVAKEASASAEKASREAAANVAVASSKEVSLEEAVERSKNLVAAVEKGARGRLETQIETALRALSGAEERANQKTAAALKQMQETAARVNQTATSVAGTSQALRDEVKALSDRIDAFMTGFRTLNK